jgi:hypothetical protein
MCEERTIDREINVRQVRNTLKDVSLRFEPKQQ